MQDFQPPIGVEKYVEKTECQQYFSWKIYIYIEVDKSPPEKKIFQGINTNNVYLYM